MIAPILCVFLHMLRQNICNTLLFSTASIKENRKSFIALTFRPPAVKMPCCTYEFYESHSQQSVYRPTKNPIATRNSFAHQFFEICAATAIKFQCICRHAIYELKFSHFVNFQYVVCFCYLAITVINQQKQPPKQTYKFQCRFRELLLFSSI